MANDDSFLPHVANDDSFLPHVVNDDSFLPHVVNGDSFLPHVVSEKFFLSHLAHVYSFLSQLINTNWFSIGHHVHHLHICRPHLLLTSRCWLAVVLRGCCDNGVCRLLCLLTPGLQHCPQLVHRVVGGHHVGLIRLTVRLKCEVGTQHLGRFHFIQANWLAACLHFVFLIGRCRFGRRRRSFRRHHKQFTILVAAPLCLTGDMSRRSLKGGWIGRFHGRLGSYDAGSGRLQRWFLPILSLNCIEGVLAEPRASPLAAFLLLLLVGVDYVSY